MTPSSPSDARTSRLPWLLLLFVGSGAAALIYEIVWFQLLQQVVGASAVSLAVLLGTFMGGMCLGSLWFPRVVPARFHPLKVYAVIEVLLAAFALVVMYGMPVAERAYLAAAGHGMPSIALRAVICVIFLLPPTLLMGATLPAVARWVESTPRGVAWLGFFYGGNIAGAVTGCLLAGFYLLRVHDLATATFTGMALNLAVAGIALLVARGTVGGARTDEVEQAPVSHAGSLYVVVAISGLCALGSEVIWTRLLSLLLGGTVYTFSIILAMFLTGLGIGSTLGSLLARVVARPGLVLAGCQLVAAVGMVWTGYMINRWLPAWPVQANLTSNPWMLFQLDLVRSALAVLPSAIAWGATFPLALAILARRGAEPGRLVGRLYAANTVGAILGATLIGLVLVPAFGTQQTQRILVLGAVGAGLVLLVLNCSRQRAIPAAAVIAFYGVGLAWLMPPLAEGLVTYGRYSARMDFTPVMLYMGEGMNSSVAVTERPAMDSGVYRNFHVSGKVEASTDPYDMRLQRMLGHMPALVHPAPKTVLIVGCGAGVTAGSFIVHPSVERIVICEIEPLIPGVVATYFSKENHNLLTDPRVEIVYDDARHYIMTTKEKFDVITSDPIHPWVKGAAALYTKEYLELCKARLNPGGVIGQWVPLYESSSEVVKSEVATFLEVFPEGSIWGNQMDGSGYDTIMLARLEPMKIDIDALQARLEQPDHAAVRASMYAVGYSSVFDLFGTFAAKRADLDLWLAGAEINRESNLRLMYLAGLSANLQMADTIYREITFNRAFPDDIFAPSSEAGRTRLRDIMGP
ncbi:MAG TPA: fused MFS/spermidine synthase [Opitutaceae bacterium]